MKITESLVFIRFRQFLKSSWLYSVILLTGLFGIVWIAMYDRSPEAFIKRIEQAERASESRLTEAQAKMKNYTDETVVFFADKLVESTIRSKYIKTRGDITVADMKALTTFEYVGDYSEGCDPTKTINTLFDLQYCENLETLMIGIVDTHDLTPLRKLTKIKSLILWGGEEIDLSSLAGMVHLETLQIINATIQDATPVLTLPNLKSLSFISTEIKGISAIPGTSQLTHFTCESKLDDYSPLYRLKDLKSITLTSISNDDFIGILKNMKNLTHIRINSSHIEDSSLELMQDMKHLTGLCLQGCGIQNISALSRLTALQDLRLNNNDIVDITPLAKLGQIGCFLDLGGNSVKDLSPLKCLKNLKAIHMPYPEDRVLIDELKKNGCDVNGKIPAWND